MSLKVAIVGTGWFSRVHASILAAMDGVVVRAFCGTSIEKARQIANEFNANGYDNVDVMLDTEEVDALYICVPPYAHGKVEQAAIDRNIPFLVEKPLGVSDEEPSRIVEQIKRDQLITSVGYHFRYQDSIQQMKTILQGEKVGMSIGKWMGSMPEVAWWRDQNRSGGQFNEQTTHIVDLIRYVIGEVKDVYASYATTSINQKYEGVSVADVGSVTLTLKNGTVASITNTCILPGNVSEVGLSVYTSNGLLEWNPERLLTRMANNGDEYHNEGNPYERESAAFLHAVQTGDRSKILSTYEDAYQTFKVTEAALRSAESGERVEV